MLHDLSNGPVGPRFEHSGRVGTAPRCYFMKTSKRVALQSSLPAIDLFPLAQTTSLVPFDPELEPIGGNRPVLKSLDCAPVLLDPNGSRRRRKAETRYTWVRRETRARGAVNLLPLARGEVRAVERNADSRRGV